MSLVDDIIEGYCWVKCATQQALRKDWAKIIKDDRGYKLLIQIRGSCSHWVRPQSWGSKGEDTRNREVGQKTSHFKKIIIIRLNIYFVWKITFTFYKTLSKKKLSLSRPRKRPKFVSIKFLPTVLLNEQLISLMWDIFARDEWETSDSIRWCLYWDSCNIYINYIKTL